MIDTFLGKLREAAPHFTWTLKLGFLRGRRGRYGPYNFCPVTAVYLRERGKVLPSSHARVEEVWRAVGLESQDEAEVVTYEADLGCVGPIGRDLLTAVGLAPTTSPGQSPPAGK